MAFCGAWYFLVPDHVDVFYNPWGLCALVTLVFMLSFLAGIPEPMAADIKIFFVISAGQ